MVDVFHTEPLPSASPLWDCSKLTITPHIAAVSDPADVAEVAVNNFEAVLSGGTPKQLVDFAAGY